jgi:hypothetical protein
MGQYKEKNCKFCNKLHKKRGPYCSQSCANKDRTEYSQKVADNMRKVAVEYNKTPEAIAQQKLLHTGISIEDFCVDVPDIREVPDLDGYDRAENW